LAKLSKKPLVDRSILETLGETRLKEAEVLRDAGHYCGAIYLGGYAVECYLKVAICKAMDWDELRETFMSHDLKTLLVHSGLERKIRDVPGVQRSFKQISEVWVMETRKAIRYQDTATFKFEDARKFLNGVADEKVGVVPWVKSQI